MKLQVIPPHKALNKAYLKQSVKRDQIETFKAALARMFERLRPDESEEHLKNIVADFLKDAWYRDSNEINTSGRKDLVIHGGKSSKDPVAVIVEVKRPANRNEMISPERANVKALHELLHYYMQERYIRNNKEIRHLIICNIEEWYIFDAVDFERFFFGNQKLVKSYKDWNDGCLVSANTDWFYQEIAKPFIEKEFTELPCTCFNLREFEKIVRNSDKADDRKLINLYKLLSPPHLLKQPFANDSNSLNREFYSELLHIIGLEEVKEKGKKLIRRKPESARNDGALLENTIVILKRRTPSADEDQLFSTALELCITWLNRLLFLKLLEGQLIAWHRGDRARAFLTSSRIEDFDDLNELFFDVLAVRPDERPESVRASFGDIPYLNSSLFEESDLERATLRISELKNRLDLPLYPATVLKDAGGKRLAGGKKTLHYLFEFLDAYDFAADGSAEIQEQNKTLINAAVLGLIFEKINGYRDGSFYTPGFITMYICRETIRRAILRRFNEHYGWSCADFTELYNRIDPGKLREANGIVNGLKVCDPAVGSGHFLVSALNEIIAAKSDLGILLDKDGRRLREYQVAIENDELIVTHDDRIFEYNHRDPESQRVQETLFHEKETIIENCLFGVDINPKSVAICRLRLWIELLKNAYYRRGTDELETLPNIDINIKCGNSLISRFAIGDNPAILPADRKKLKELTEKYRRHVTEYKLSPANKAQLRTVIDDLKHSLENFGLPSDRDLATLRKKENEVAQLGFAFDKKGAAARKKLMEEVEVLRARFEEKQRSIYHNAFEWRFEFPEVLDENGEFAGFDVVIGNPPYGNLVTSKLQKYFSVYYQHQDYQNDLYLLFLERFYGLLNNKGYLGVIIPNTWLQSITLRKIRKHLTNSYSWQILLHLPDNVFDAVVDTLVLIFKKDEANELPREAIPVYVKNDMNIVLSHRLDWSEIPKSGDPINIVADSQALRLFRKITFVSLRLSDVCIVCNGVKPFEKGKGTPPQTDQILKDKPYVCEGPAPDDSWSPLLRGSLIQRYKILWEKNYWIQYGPWLAAPRDASIFEAPQKIMVRQTGDSIIATFVEGGFIARNNLHILLPESKNFSLLYVLGLLNSTVMDFIYSLMNPEKGEALAEVKKRHVEQLPIPTATPEQQAPIVERVEKILANPGSPDVPQLEAEIDRLVYELYGLTSEEIALVEGKG